MRTSVSFGDFPAIDMFDYPSGIAYPYGGIVINLSVSVYINNRLSSISKLVSLFFPIYIYIHNYVYMISPLHMRIPMTLDDLKPY